MSERPQLNKLARSPPAGLLMLECRTRPPYRLEVTCTFATRLALVSPWGHEMAPERAGTGGFRPIAAVSVSFAAPSKKKKKKKKSLFASPSIGSSLDQRAAPPASAAMVQPLVKHKVRTARRPRPPARALPRASSTLCRAALRRAPPAAAARSRPPRPPLTPAPRAAPRRLCTRRRPSSSACNATARSPSRCVMSVASDQWAFGRLG